MFHDRLIAITFLVVAVLLVIAGLTARVLKARATAEHQTLLVKNLDERILSWWVMAAVLAAAMSLGRNAGILLFFFVSFQALREFITLTPTRRADHRPLFWAFFVILPLNYILIALRQYGIFSIFIPVYAFLWIPIREALAADTRDFLARTAKIQWGLMVCVYFISYAPALMNLSFKSFGDHGDRLLLFLVLVIELSDILQYVFGKLCGKTKVAPLVSPNKTLEGCLGGMGSAVLVGASLWWLTPFQPWQAALIALLICVVGFAGGLVMSAVKRDIGVKDYGTLIPGHGGMLDRIDSLCFAAPVFFHVTRFFFGGWEE